MAEEIYDGAIGIDLGKSPVILKRTERSVLERTDLCWRVNDLRHNLLLRYVFDATDGRYQNKSSPLYTDTDSRQLQTMKEPMSKSLPMSKVVLQPHPSSPSPTRNVWSGSQLRTRLLWTQKTLSLISSQYHTLKFLRLRIVSWQAWIEGGWSGVDSMIRQWKKIARVGHSRLSIKVGTLWLRLSTWARPRFSLLKKSHLWFWPRYVTFYSMQERAELIFFHSDEGGCRS